MAFFYNNNVKPLSISSMIVVLCVMVCLSGGAISSSRVLSSSAPIVPNSSGELLIKFQIGTPPVEVSGVADFDTDLTWIPCSSNNNNANIFDPEKSKTYRNISCGSDQCGLLDYQIQHCNEEQQPCECLIDDTGRSYVSVGKAGAETLTLDRESTYAQVVFGCEYENVSKAAMNITGVVGLGSGPSSIVRQFGGSKFSYCLSSSTTSDSNVSSGKIRFGSDAVVTGRNVVSTPLKEVKYSGRSYYIWLEGISVGNKRLDFNDSDLKRFGNIVVDSRNTNTKLVSAFYDQLESALVDAINGTNSGGKRVPDPREGGTGLCYTAATMNYPAVTVHFEGADLVLPRQNTFVEVAAGVVCSTFSRINPRSQEFQVFGTLQQRNILVGFDLDNQKLNFLPTDCA